MTLQEACYDQLGTFKHAVDMEEGQVWAIRLWGDERALNDDGDEIPIEEGDMLLVDAESQQFVMKKKDFDLAFSPTRIGTIFDRRV